MAFLICSLLLQGLQGIQGPKVSCGAWVESPLLTPDPQPGQFQKVSLMGSEGPTLGPSPAPCYLGA